MNKPSLRVRLPLTALGISLATVLIVTIIGLVKAWALVDFSNALFISGAVAITLAILSSFGGWGNRADFGQIYSQSAGDMSLAERSRLWVQDMTRGYNAVLLLSLVGALLIGLSILVGSFIG
jgi:hypothetical protein